MTDLIRACHLTIMIVGREFAGIWNFLPYRRPLCNTQKKWESVYKEGSCLAEVFFSQHFKHEFVDILVPMVKLEFTFFQVEIKRVFCQAPKANEPSFGKSPKAFNTVDV